MHRTESPLHSREKCLKLPHMSANEKHKDSIFSRLFSNPDTLRELYSAIEGVELPPDPRWSLWCMCTT